MKAPERMDPLVDYRFENGVATIAMDDGKMNAQSPRMIRELGVAFDRAEADRAVVIVTGRTGVFSAGFDLNVLRAGGLVALRMVRGGFVLAERVLSFPYPVVVACTGHAMAMGAFLVLSADHRVGAAGPFKITTNEVAIGLTMPHAAVEICRQRLSPAHLTRAAVLAEVYDPNGAVTAGFLDEVVAPDLVVSRARERADELTKLDMRAHAATKARVREDALRTIHASIDRDTRELALLGARRLLASATGTTSR